jgi:hypothetical protein
MEERIPPCRGVGAVGGLCPHDERTGAGDLARGKRCEMTNITRLHVFAIVCLILSGCASDSVTVQRTKPYYSWGFYNPTLEVLDEVHAVYHSDGRQDTPGAGWLGPDRGAGYGPGLYPIPETVTLSWISADGQRHEAVMDVGASVPHADTFSGRIYLVYLGREHGWKVVPLTAQELDDQAIRAARGTLGQRNPLVPTPDKYLPATRPAGDAGE